MMLPTDSLHQEKRLIATVLSAYEGLELTSSWIEPDSASNVHLIEGGSCKLLVRVTHVNPISLLPRALCDAIKLLAADMEYYVTC